MEIISTDVFRNLIGCAIDQTVWGAKVGYGSFLTLNIGLPSDDEPDIGDYYLWVYCSAWRIEANGKVIASSEDDRDLLDAGAVVLNGRQLADFTVDPVSLSAVVSLSGNARIIIFAIYTQNFEHWKMRLPSGRWVQAGPSNQLILLD